MEILALYHAATISTNEVNWISQWSISTKSSIQGPFMQIELKSVEREIGSSTYKNLH